MCKENEKDITEIKPEYVTGLKFHYVEDITDVLDIALLKTKVKDAKTFAIPEEKK